MIGKNRKQELLNVFHEGLEINVQNNLKNERLTEFCKALDNGAVKQVCEKIQANIVSAIPEGYSIPKASLYVTCTGNGSEITLISITLTNGWKDDKKFKFSIQIPVADQALMQIINFFKAAYDQLMLDMMITENVTGINELYAELVQIAGVSYSVKMVSPLNQMGKKIAYIGNDEVVFVADAEKVFDVDEIMVFQSTDEDITEEMITKAKQQLADELGLCQTTVSLVNAHGGSLIKIMSNIGSLVKAMSLIRKVNTKNVERMKGTNDTAAYYEKDKVYAVVARQDGNFQILLSPFSTETLDPVDVDVLAAINA